MFVNKSLYLKGKKYISASRAADITGYANDYIGQLCRSKKITATLVGRGWYVLESEILDHKNKNLSLHKKTLNTRKLKKDTLLLKLKTREDDFEEDKNKKGKIVIFQKKITLESISYPFENRNKMKSHISDIRDIIAVKPLYYQSKNKLGLGTTSIRDDKTLKPLYYNDNKPLFPVLEKKFDGRYITLNSIEKAIKKSQKKSGFERFTNNISIIILALLLTKILAFGTENFTRTPFANFGENVKKELAFIYGSNSNNFKK